MKRNFNLSPKQSEEFLRYLLSAMRNPKSGMIEGDGSGHWEDDLYISEQAAHIHTGEKKVFVHWKITHRLNGELVSVENTFGNDSPEYKLVISDFLSDIYERVISQPKDTFFQRRYLRTISGCNLPGEYWFDGIRFAPLFPDDDSALMNAERIVVIDQAIDAVDINHAREVADLSTKLYSAYISLILDIPLEEKRHEEIYFLTKESKTYEMERHSTQLIDTTGISEMPSKGSICKHVKFEGSVYDTLKFTNNTLYCPKETRRIFRGLESASKEIQEAFTKCALMYQLGACIGYSRPTVKISYEYGAIDAIIHSDKSEYKGFTPFMTKYAGENSDFYDFIHSKIRSAHWHAGEFNFGEFQSREFSIHSPGRFNFLPIMETHKVMRTAILNWLDEKIAFSSEESESKED